MADNVVLPGTGSNIAADEVGSTLVQRVKLMLGANGENDGDVHCRNGIPITFADSPAIDAFGLLRVANPVMLLDTKRVGGVPDLIMTESVTGSGATSYQINRASTFLTVGPAAGKVVRQTKARGVYQPGKSLKELQTFVMAAGQTNLRQRVGYHDAKNGIFLEKDGSALRFVIRSFLSGAAVDTIVEQAAWSEDKLDGTGKSGMTLDSTKAQIVYFDLEYLGVGRVRCYFVINGRLIEAHHFNHANLDASAYMSNPNLPMRWEIEATGAITGTATLESICGTLASEGGYEVTGVTASTDGGTTGKALASGANGELLALRMASSFTEVATAFIQAMSAINTTSGSFRWQIVLNPTETVAGTWGAVSGSIMEKNTGRTVTANTGIVIASGFVSSTNNQVNLEARPVLTCGTTLANVSDVFSLQIYNLSNQTETFFGSLTWREVY